MEERRSPWRREREASLRRRGGCDDEHRFPFWCTYLPSSLLPCRSPACHVSTFFPPPLLLLAALWSTFPSVLHHSFCFSLPFPPLAAGRAVLRALASACRAPLPPPTAAVFLLPRCRQRLARNCLRQPEPFPFCIYSVSRFSLALPFLSLLYSSCCFCLRCVSSVCSRCPLPVPSN